MSTKRFDFSLTSDAASLLCPNANEFYTKAMLSDEALDSFRLFTGVKDSFKVANIGFTNVIKAFGCEPDYSNSALTSVAFEVCPLQIAVEICQSDLEVTFDALHMKKGSNSGPMGSAEFMTMFWDELAKTSANDLAILTWQGNTDSSLPVIGECDGLEKKFNASYDAGTTPGVAKTNIDSSNVVAELNKYINGLPAALKGRYDLVTFYLAPNVIDALIQASGAHNIAVFLDTRPQVGYLGYKIIPAYGSTANTILLGKPENLIYGTDLKPDMGQLKVIDMSVTTGRQSLRAVANFKFFVGFVNPSEFVFSYS